jgi:hypothetical protein
VASEWLGVDGVAMKSKIGLGSHVDVGWLAAGRLLATLARWRSPMLTANTTPDGS